MNQVLHEQKSIFSRRRDFEHRKKGLSKIFLKYIRILIPLGHSFDSKEDIDFLFKNLLEFDPSELSNILKYRSLFSYEDILLGIFGNIKHNECFYHTVFLHKIVHVHEDIVWEFFAEREEYLFADNLADTGFHILVGIIVLIIEKRSGRK